MADDEIIYNMDDLKQCVNSLILYTAAQEKPVVQCTLKIGHGVDFEEAIETAVDMITNSHLSETHEVAANPMTIMKDLPYREFRLTISIR